MSPLSHRVHPAASSPAAPPPRHCCSFIALIALAGVFAAWINVPLRSLIAVPTGRACLAAVDNIGGRDFSPRLCHDPIDVVYTWVNGSDAAWFKEMVAHKRA